MSEATRRSSSRAGRLESQLHGEDEPVLAALEDAVPVGELALAIVEGAERLSIEEGDPVDAFGEGVPVSAGIAVDRGANVAGQARQRLDAPQAALDRVVDQSLKFRAGVGRDASAIRADAGRGVAQHDPVEALVGHDEVASTADGGHPAPRGARHPQRRDEAGDVGGFDKHGGGPADPEARVQRQRDAGGHLQVGDSGERLENPARGSGHRLNYRGATEMPSGFTGFPAEALTFLRGLKKNNNREWFQAHKPVFEEKVKAPMLELIGELNLALAGFAPDYVTDPAKAYYRIYRDTRFSPDKTPYKTHISALFRPRGLDKHSCGSLYFQISAGETGVAGGIYMPGPEELLAVRTHLAQHHERLRRHPPEQTATHAHGRSERRSTHSCSEGLPLRPSRLRLDPDEAVVCVGGARCRHRDDAKAVCRASEEVPGDDAASRLSQ